MNALGIDHCAQTLKSTHYSTWSSLHAFRSDLGNTFLFLSRLLLGDDISRNAVRSRVDQNKHRPEGKSHETEGDATKENVSVSVMCSMVVQDLQSDKRARLDLGVHAI